jgi:hypothetical protein
MENLSYDQVESLLTELKDSFNKVLKKDQEIRLHFFFVKYLNEIKVFKKENGSFNPQNLENVRGKIIKFTSICTKLLLE